MTTKAAEYAVKCDDCKKTIRTTEEVRESYAGGRCGDCKARASLASARAAVSAKILGRGFDGATVDVI